MASKPPGWSGRDLLVQAHTIDPGRSRRHPYEHVPCHWFLPRGRGAAEATQRGAVTWLAAIHRATCSRESTPSLLKMLARWLSTVRSEMNRLPATWAFVAPSATSDATSISRRESGPASRRTFSRGRARLRDLDLASVVDHLVARHRQPERVGRLECTIADREARCVRCLPVRFVGTAP